MVKARDSRHFPFLSTHSVWLSLNLSTDIVDEAKKCQVKSVQEHVDLIQKRYTRINKNRVYKMSKEKFHRRRYDLLFKLSVLKDYYESGCSEYSISKKYDLKGTSSLRRWIETFPLDDKSLSLCEKLKEKIIQSRHMKEKARASKQLTEKEKLQEEILLLRKALQYSELRNEALNEMIRIAKEEDGYDVLKKRGAKQP